jgi:hypothetical protein
MQDRSIGKWRELEITWNSHGLLKELSQHLPGVNEHKRKDDQSVHSLLQAGFVRTFSKYRPKPFSPQTCSESRRSLQRTGQIKMKHFSRTPLYFVKNIIFKWLHVSNHAESSTGLRTKPLEHNPLPRQAAQNTAVIHSRRNKLNRL